MIQAMHACSKFFLHSLFSIASLCIQPVQPTLCMLASLHVLSRRCAPPPSLRNLRRPEASCS